jgi:hypothetical protein
MNISENWKQGDRVLYRNAENASGKYSYSIIGSCILLRVYQSDIGITSIRNTVFLVLDFVVHFSHYMFRPRLEAILRWFANTKNIQGSHYIFSGSVE